MNAAELNAEQADAERVRLLHELRAEARRGRVLLVYIVLIVTLSLIVEGLEALVVWQGWAAP